MRFQPQGVRQRFFEALEQRLNLPGGFAERTDVVNVSALKSVLNLIEKFLHAVLVHAESIERRVVDVFIQPLVRLLENVGGQNLLLRLRRAQQRERQNYQPN